MIQSFYRRRALLVLALIANLLASACASAQSGELYRKKSEFNLVIVRQSEDGIRQLLFEDGGAVQTAIDMNDPPRLVHAYARAIMASLAVAPTPQRIMIVGLGGGVMPAFLRRNFPDAQIDIAELDPEVFAVAKRFFNFREDPKMKVYVGDGRKFIEQTANRYDIIYLDAYGADSIPYMLATKEFMTAVRAKLADGGIAVSNVWGPSSNRLYASMLRTYEAVFAELHVVRAPYSENRILIALTAKKSLTQKKLVELANQIEPNLKPRLDLGGMIEAGYQSPGIVGGGTVLLDKDAPKE